MFRQSSAGQTETVECGSDRKLAILGGPPAIDGNHQAMFHWPIVTAEDTKAVADVMVAGTISGTEITRKFEREFADWMGLKYAVGCCNGTAAMQETFWACGVGLGDEVICPSMTYWASCMPALAFGAAVNFADIDPETLCIDPADIEHRISSRTKAIVVIHYAGYPADMDPIMAIARKHKVKVIEDVSHAHGTMYKGRMCGTIGDIAGISMMCGKSFAIGEGGMVVTNNRELYERCLIFGHYERVAASRFSKASETLSDPELAEFAGLAIGGVKHRMSQTASAMGRVQLKYYPERIREIQKAMNYFWDQLEGLPGVRPHRVKPDSGSTMGGWYYPRALYRAGELGGLSCEKFCEALAAEGFATAPGGNYPLHLHPAFHKLDLLHAGKPAMIAFTQRDVRQGKGSLPVTERINEIVLGAPWFKHYRPEIIDQYAAAYRKVIEQHRELL